MGSSENRDGRMDFLSTLPDHSGSVPPIEPGLSQEFPSDDPCPWEQEGIPGELDEYRLLAELGAGGMGRVYLARDTLLDREVAIKLIAQPDSSRRERFAIEARAAARLHHPNIVSVYRIGQVGELPYIVSEYVRGNSLAHMAKPVPWQRAREIAVALARALATAHRHGVLHRDIKPDNVIVSEAGEPKLADFGLAKLIDIDALSGGRGGEPAHGEPGNFDDGAKPGGITEEGAILGTPYYMAPEVWAGEAATTRSDVYSFGVLLYELCAGRVPHGDVSPRALQFTVVTQQIPPLASCSPDIDPDFAAFVDGCLALAPADRLESGQAVLDALAVLDRDKRAPVALEGSPYRGLLPFEAEHKALFFGRDADIQAVIDRLRTETVVLVAGQSGVGKSSLIRAGVLPRIVEHGLGDGRSWRACSMVPGANPLTSLASELGRHIRSDESGDSASLASELEHDLTAASRRLRHWQGDGRGTILFVDQLEELVTLSEPAQAKVASRALAELAQRAPGVRFLATVRGDKLTELAQLPGLGRLIERSLYILRSLGEDDIRDAIEGPARARGVAFESNALVETLVASTLQASGGLPLLQFALAQALGHPRSRARDHSCRCARGARRCRGRADPPRRWRHGSALASHP